MLNKIFQKGLTSLLITSMLVISGSSLFIAPKEAQAIFGLGDIVSDPWNTIQNTISAAGSAARTGLQTSLGLKEFTLDAIAYAVAKQILRQITTDTVNWINSGFDGNPAFVNNPSQFFLDIGDEIVGKFLESMELTNFLCSPFSIDVRLALAFRYRPFQKRVPTCTLSEVIKNSQNAVEGANINGFTAGDFKQGGWPAFVSMTTEPQNNQYGAFIEADTELALQIGNKKILKQNDLFQGKGFLSWEKCTETGNEDHSERADEGSGEGSYTGPERSFEGSGEGYVPEKVCETQTPGGVIAGQLETTLGSPVRELELADEFNEIINALFAQMIKQMLTGGLRAISGSGPTDPDAYINQLQAEKTSVQLENIRSGVLQSIDRYINQSSTFRHYYNQALNYALGIKTDLESVKTCYSDKLNATPNSLTANQKETAQRKIIEIDGIISQRISPVTVPLYSTITVADTHINRLTTIKQASIDAQTVNQISPIAEEYNRLIVSTEIIDEKELIDAQAETEIIQNGLSPLSAETIRLKQACQIFPAVVN